MKAEKAKTPLVAAVDKEKKGKEITMSEAEEQANLKGRLSPLQYAVTQQCGTERPFTGKYWDTKTEGVYHCIVCDAPLFKSESKYDSGSGWPSFWEPVGEDTIAYKEDKTPGLGTRIEVQCAQCGSHLGHVFEDGPQPTGQRYCINSASLDLDESD